MTSYIRSKEIAAGEMAKGKAHVLAILEGAGFVMDHPVHDDAGKRVSGHGSGIAHPWTEEFFEDGRSIFRQGAVTLPA